jgi:hypothetical protein
MLNPILEACCRSYASGGMAELRLARLLALSRGEFSQAIRDSVLKFRVVGIQAHCFPGESFVLRCQVEKECFRRRMYCPHRLNSAAPCPLRWMGKRITCRSFGHEAGLIQVGRSRNQRPPHVSERHQPPDQYGETTKTTPPPPAS